MKTIQHFTGIVVCLCLLQASAIGQPTIAVSREVLSGLDGNGWLIPGTPSTALRFTIAVDGNASSLSALGYAETIPPDRSFTQKTAISTAPASVAFHGPRACLIDIGLWQLLSAFCR